MPRERAAHHASGGLIDRSQSLSFFFASMGGSTAASPAIRSASALLANGVHLVGRSFKYHRPRGILAAGAEEAQWPGHREPGQGPHRPRTCASRRLNCMTAWSRPARTAGRALRAMSDASTTCCRRSFPPGSTTRPSCGQGAPGSRCMNRSSACRSRARRGAAALPDPDRYAQGYAHCDVLIVGAGPAGLGAATRRRFDRGPARVILSAMNRPNSAAAWPRLCKRRDRWASGPRLGAAHGRRALAQRARDAAASHDSLWVFSAWSDRPE